MRGRHKFQFMGLIKVHRIDPTVTVEHLGSNKTGQSMGCGSEPCVQFTQSPDFTRISTSFMLRYFAHSCLDLWCTQCKIANSWDPPVLLPFIWSLNAIVMGFSWHASLWVSGTHASRVLKYSSEFTKHYYQATTILTMTLNRGKTTCSWFQKLTCSV